jgi:phage terminase small subunit
VSAPGKANGHNGARRSPKPIRALANLNAPSSGEPPATADSGIGELEELFVRQYLIDLSAAAAYRRCKPGVTEGSARALGCQMLGRPAVQARIERLRGELFARLELRAEHVLAELKRVAFSNMRQFASWGPEGVSLLASDQLSDDAARCVAEVSETVGKHGRSIRFKLHDKLAALTRMGEHLGLWKHGRADAGRCEVILDPDGSVRIVTAGDA